MAGKESGAPFQRIEIERLRRENEQLRRELKAAGRESKRGKPKPKKERKKPGRKAGQGPFTFRQAPPHAASAPPVEVPVTVCQCPGRGGELLYERTDEATVTDMPPAAQPDVKSYAVEVGRWRTVRTAGTRTASGCGPGSVWSNRAPLRPARESGGAHGALRHRVPVRKLPVILRELTGIKVTQSALTQDPLKKSEGAVGKRRPDPHKASV